MVIAHDGLLDGREGAHGVAVRAAQRLRNDLVHDLEVDQLGAGDAQRLRGLWRVSSPSKGIPPPSIVSCRGIEARRRGM